MGHDELTLVALGEQAPSQTELAHLDLGPACAESLAALTEVVGVGRDTQGLADLLPPPARVWQAIAESFDLPVPPTIDTSAYRVVDISAQPLNSDPAHGQSMLRGSLG
jgi:hypothetical protein